MPQKKRQFVCEECGNTFASKHFVPDPPRYCSPKCRGIASRGENSPQFKGGITVDGYRIVRHNGRQVHEHRVVMESIIGRPLVRPEHVHHIDGDKLNNAPGNLVLCSKTDCAVKLRTYTRRPIEDRFWEKVQKSEGCWTWTGNTDTQGYGLLWAMVDGKDASIRATHLSYAIAHGLTLPLDGWILHDCDNPICVNPDHLHIGDHSQNMREAVERGRMPTGLRNGAYTKPGSRARGDRHWSKTKPESIARGEKQGRAKLTESDVIAIRKIMDANPPRGTGVALARAYGVTPTKITQVAKRQCWKHLP